MEPALQELYAEGSPDDEVAVIIRLTDSTDLPQGVRIITQFGQIATVRLPRREIPRVRREVASMKRPKLYSYDDCACSSRQISPAALEAEVSRSDPGEEAVEFEISASDQRRPSGDLPTGRGVVVAHIDWGVDILHPEFRYPGGRTRLLAFWDQSAAMSPQQSNRYGYGRIYDAANIDRALSSPDPYAVIDYNPGTASHGTHTLSISAGNGASDGPVGLAPEASLIFVHLSTYTPEGPALLGDSVALLEALDFILRTAGARPVVVNTSLGRHAGEHDGKTLTEQGMDAFLLAAPGRAIVQSCGNYYNKNIHAQGVLRPGQSRTLRFITDQANRVPNELDLWYPGTDRFGVRLRGPGDTPEISVQPGGSTPIMSNGKHVGTIYDRLCDPNNGDNEVTVFLYPTAPAGEWALILTGEDVADGRFHAWLERDATCPGCQAHFVPGASNPTRTIGTIANGLRTIAVGAYDAHRDERPLAPFSSSGPTRDGRIKPDLVAPGVRILAGRSRARGAAPDAALLTCMSGTSMAAPHVTGTVALMFAAAGRPLFIEETRRLLLTSTDAAPDSEIAVRLRFGSGYLNTEAAVAAAKATSELAAPARRSAASGVRGGTPKSGEIAAVDTERNNMPQRDNEAKAETIATGPEAERAAENGEAEAPSTKDRRSDAFARRPLPPQFRPRPSQVQVPITGGPPSLALPFGARSPVAFTVPLGGTALQPPPAAAPPAIQPGMATPPPAGPQAGLPQYPAAPAPSQAGPVLPQYPTAPPSPDLPQYPTALPAIDVPPQASAAPPSPVPGGEEPLTVAADIPLYVPPTGEAEPQAYGYGEAILYSAERVAQLGGAPRSSSGVLTAVLSDAAGVREAESESFDVFGLGSHTPSATTLFNAFAFPAHPLRARAVLRRQYESRFQPIAIPGQPIADVSLRPGDLLVRIARGEGWGHIAVIASNQFRRHLELANAGLRGEGYPRLLPGGYVHVVEIGPRPRSFGDRFARRLSDATGAVLPDTLLLRPVLGLAFGEQTEAAEPAATRTAAPGSQNVRPVLRLGSIHPAVRELQRQLNRIDIDLKALSLPGLAGCPLKESDRFDAQTAQAVAAFQQQVFDDPAKWDAVAGPETWAQLDLLAGKPAVHAESATLEAEANGSNTLIVTAPAIPVSIVVANPIVIVKKSYTTPSRTLVTLRSGPFSGTGTFRRSNAHINFFTAASGGRRLAFDGTDNVFPSAQLSAGVQLFAEGASPSGTVNDVTIALTLRPGAGPTGTPATAQMTAVEVTLDICRSQTSAGAAPPPLSTNDKLNVGRFIQVQDTGNNAERAMLLVRQAQPAAFTGKLVLTTVDSRVTLFQTEAPGAPALTSPREIDNSTIPATGLPLFVQAGSASGAIRDTGIQLGIKDVDATHGDRVAITAVSFTRIRATIKPTPANTPRTGIAAPANHTFDTTGISGDFALTPPLVLMRNAQPDIDLEVSSTPPGLPIVWQVIRNSADHASLGDATAVLPVTANASDPTKARVNANQKGSFRVRAFIETSGTRRFQGKEPSIPLNLVLADATVVADNSIANPGSLVATPHAGGLNIANGSWPSSAGLTAADLAAAGMAMQLVADVTGGGPDGRLGLDKVFCGLVNDLRNVVIRGTYHNPGPPAGDVHLNNIYVSNGASATGSLSSKPLFKPGDPRPTPWAWPLLDSGRPTPGQGGETATMSASGPHTRVTRPLGERWTMQCIDSPGRSFPKTHPLNPAAILSHVRYRQEFVANFCFWTNINGTRGATGHSADRLYSVLRIVPWEIDGEWDVAFPPAGPPTLTAITPHRVSADNSRRVTIRPIERAQNHRVEVRPPSGIGQAIAWDGRT